MNSEAPPNDPWTLWRYAKVLASFGHYGVATERLDAVLANPETPDNLRTMAEDQKRQGWKQPKAFKWEPGQPLPF